MCTFIVKMFGKKTICICGNLQRLKFTWAINHYIHCRVLWQISYFVQFISTELNSFVLFRSVPFRSVLFCSVLFCYVLLCSVLLCSARFWSALFCSVLFCSYCVCIAGFTEEERPHVPDRSSHPQAARSSCRQMHRSGLRYTAMLDYLKESGSERPITRKVHTRKAHLYLFLKKFYLWSFLVRYKINGPFLYPKVDLSGTLIKWTFLVWAFLVLGLSDPVPFKASRMPLGPNISHKLFNTTFSFYGSPYCI